MDKKTALALWETSIPPAGARKKKGEENEEDEVENSKVQTGIMNFTMFTKKGNKAQVGNPTSLIQITQFSI